MKKSTEAGCVTGTAKNQNTNPVITEVSLSNRLTISETERGIIARMDKCTPDNELKLRGWH